MQFKGEEEDEEGKEEERVVRGGVLSVSPAD